MQTSEDLNRRWKQWCNLDLESGKAVGDVQIQTNSVFIPKILISKYINRLKSKEKNMDSMWCCSIQ